MIVTGDTSGLVAAFNTDDPHHVEATTALKSAAATIIAPLVMLEIEHIMTRLRGRDAAYRVNDWLLRHAVSGRVIVPTVDDDALRRARKIQDVYRDVQLDLTDAILVVVAAEYETATVLTLDHRDFRAISPLTDHTAFRLLPDDLTT